METMEDRYRDLFTKISPSVVIVEQVGEPNSFCIGSVILNDDTNSFILTQTNLLDLSSNLCVRFSNGFKQPATVLISSERSKLCILITKFYPKCKEVEFFSGDINHSHAAVIAPATKSSVYNLPCFNIQKSLQCGVRTSQDPLQGTEDRFTLACLYGDTGPNGASRILQGPIFNMDGEVLGIVEGDMMFKHFTPDRQGKEIHEDLYTYCSYDLKIGMSASAVQVLLGNIVGDKDWKNAVIAKAKGTP